MKNYSSNSWIVNVIKTLQLYGMPSFNSLLVSNFTKQQMKTLFVKNVTKYWSRKLLEDTKDKTSLQYLASPPLETNDTHILWSTVANNVHEVRRAFVKAKIATGTLLLQTRQHKFGLSQMSICQLCGTEDEDICHFLVRCPALYFA